MADTLIHLSKAGDRWDLLAADYYGDARAYARIVAANPDVPITPELPGGLRLAIPVIDETAVQSSEALPPWLR